MGTVKADVKLVFGEFMAGGRRGNVNAMRKLEVELNELYAEGYRLLGPPVYIEDGDVVWTLHRVGEP